LSRYGISVDHIMALVADAIGGREAGQVIQGNERYNIYARLAKNHRNSIEAIRSLIVHAPGGALVPLHKIAKVGIESGPPQIRRDDVQRRVLIQANVEGLRPVLMTASIAILKVKNAVMLRRRLCL